MQKVHWFAVYTTSHHEKRVHGHLENRSLESYLPLYSEKHRWKNGCQVKVDLPLFPNYVFVHIAREQRVKVLQVPGILGIVSAGYEPIPMPDSELESLRSGLAHYSCGPYPYLALGDRVRIQAGPMAGLEGVLVRNQNATRVVLSIDFIQRSVAVEVNPHDLERVA